MKKFILTVFAFCLVANSLFAQKYMTRTGKISFFSSTPLENIEAFNNEVASVLDVKSGEMVFVVPIKSFKFERALMQEHFNENYMESDKFPKADFKGRVIDISNVDFKKDGTYNVKVVGKLTIHGVTRDVAQAGTITVKGGAVTAAAKFGIRPADHNIKIPSVVSGKIADHMEVTVNCVLAQK